MHFKGGTILALLKDTFKFSGQQNYFKYNFITMITACSVNDMAKNETQYERYLRNGKEIFETYCSTNDKRPIMLPRAPQQTYIDVYPNEDQPGCSFKDDRQRQLDYEAEVKVYRALEKLVEHLIVLHGFEYTIFQVN